MRGYVVGLHVVVEVPIFFLSRRIAHRVAEVNPLAKVHKTKFSSLENIKALFEINSYQVRLSQHTHSSPDFRFS